jgi:cysteine synthase A
MGVALAFVCRALGYGFVAVVDPNAPPELVERMRRLGAAVRVVDRADAHGNYLATRLRDVEERCRRDRRCVRVDQYSSPANPRVHYRDTGREIRDAMPRGVDAVFVAAGTGGTLAGVGRYFAEASPATRVIGVDVPGSAVFGGPCAPRNLSGIGSARVSSFLGPGLCHGHVVVAEAEAVALCRRLARDARVSLGGSSGAAVAACARYLREHPEVEHAVCICPDGGASYASTVYSDHWLRRVGIDPGAADPAWLTAVRPAP